MHVLLWKTDVKIWVPKKWKQRPTNLFSQVVCVTEDEFNHVRHLDRHAQRKATKVNREVAQFNIPITDQLHAALLCNFILFFIFIFLCVILNDTLSYKMNVHWMIDRFCILGTNLCFIPISFIQIFSTVSWEKKNTYVQLSICSVSPQESTLTHTSTQFIQMHTKQGVWTLYGKQQQKLWWHHWRRS